MARRRVAALQEEGFEFSDEAAEWGRWYNELKEYRVKFFLRNCCCFGTPKESQIRLALHHVAPAASQHVKTNCCSALLSRFASLKLGLCIGTGNS